MTDRPIIFSAPMVLALLDGRKTQTRRIMKPQPPEYVKHTVAPQELRGEPKRHPKPYFDAYNGGPHWCWWDEYDRQGDGWVKVPFMRGDRLYVRENWRPIPDYLSECTGPEDIDFKATFDEWDLSLSRWRPSIHMPRWASRLTLTVTHVCVQRIMDITDEDAKAEGIQQLRNGSWHWANDLPENVGEQHGYTSPAGAFHELWVEINGAGSIASNPWVVALTFTVERRNIDSKQSMEAAHA